MKKIALLGSTGSIGRQVLSVVDRYPERFKIISLAANNSAKLLSEQIDKYKPIVASLTNSECAKDIKNLPKETTLYTGENAMLHAVLKEADLVFVAVMGFAGLASVIEAIKLKKNVAIANKETLVAGGELVTKLTEENGAELIPVDSEHSAIWQCLGLDRKKDFERLIITASGGAFRNLPIEKLPYVTAEDALKHPNWNMGKKITIDCATMVNKGFEVIEAMWLFNAPLTKVKVCYHPESIVHSMVEFADGAVMAQMGYPSMELPISLAMSYPERLAGSPKLDIYGKTLHFDEIDYKRYPCFPLVMKTIELGDNYPCALSAANEEAVKLFLNGAIKFTEIYDYISNALNSVEHMPATYENLLKTDALARHSVSVLWQNKNR